MKRTCKQCGKEFELTQSEIDFYKSKNLSLPKRCKECREKNKEGNHGSNHGRKKYSLVTILIIAFIIIASFFGPKLFQSDNENQTVSVQSTEGNNTDSNYVFQSDEKLQEHYQKHGIAMGFSSAEDYEKAAAAVVTNPKALHKTESEDGDDVYYIQETNEFVIVSTAGYIRTYFNPDDGMDYYERQ